MITQKRNHTTAILVASLALILVAAAPSAMGAHHMENGEKDDKMKEDKRHDKYDKLLVEGFVGDLQLTADTDKMSLKEMVTVSLSEAAQGLDVIKGELTIVVNENEEKFLVWKLKSIEKDPESDTKTKTIYIIDAANAENTATITKEYEHKMKTDGYSHKDAMSGDKMKTGEQKMTMTKDKMKEDKMRNSDSVMEQSSNIEKRTMTANPVSTSTNSEDLRSQFVNKIQELQAAYANGDQELISQIQQELTDLKNSILQSIAT